MNKRWITGLLVAISLALVGLMAIQVQWMRNTLALKEAQFGQSVNNALYAVSDRLEHVERFQELQRHKAGRRLLLHLDTLRRDLRPWGEETVVGKNGHSEYTVFSRHIDNSDTLDVVVTVPATPEAPAAPAPPQPPAGLAGLERLQHEAMAAADAAQQAAEEAERLHAEMEALHAEAMEEAMPEEEASASWTPGPSLEESEHEALVADMVRTILAEDLGRDIHDRLDPRLLDSLINAEFLANGIDVPWKRGVYAEDGTPVLLTVDSADGELRNTAYTERLFRHDPIGPAYFLHVSIPGSQAMILRSMVPMALVSVLFIAVIVVAFVHTIRTIFRQKRISDIRNDLVNNLTHELKTPISTIGLACEALVDPSMPKTEQQVRTFVNMIRDENKRLGSLVENVLQSAVLDSGHMVLKRVELDLHALVQDVVRSSGIQVSRRNGRIELDLQAEIHHLQGDRIHLTNLLYNLIDNAVKYTEQEPRIRIATRSDDEGITVSISDNGIGIASSEQRKIFDRLYRVPTGNLHNAKGFGLGLSYVRTVVERHGGRIKVDSAPGRGSTFHITIPFEHVPAHQAAVGRR